MILTKGEEEMLRRFERKIVRKIYSPKRVAKGVYQRLMNFEIQERLQGEDVVKAIKAQMPRYGDRRRMGEEKEMKKMTE